MWVAMRILAILMALSFPLAGAGAIYRWVDDAGVTHYSDRPAPGARLADLPALSSSKAGPTPEPAPQSADPAVPSLAITSPAPGATFHDASRRVPVTVIVGPELAAGQQLRYYLDGRPLGEAGRQTSLVLTGVPRGEHRVTVAVVAGDQELARAPAVTFYMSPPSALTPLTETAPDDQQPAGAPVAPPTNRVDAVGAAPRFDTGRGQP